jgi:hypothetical protein
VRSAGRVKRRGARAPLPAGQKSPAFHLWNGYSLQYLVIITRFEPAGQVTDNPE